MAHRMKHRVAATIRRDAVAAGEQLVSSPAAAGPTPAGPNPYDTEFAAGVLHGLQFKQTYQTGDVDPEIVRQRRARNRVARRSRRINRAALLAAVALVAAAGIGTAPRAEALTYGATIRVAVQWTGGNCWARAGVHPNEHDARILAPFNVTGCHDTADSTQFVVPGGYFGADPAIGDADAVSCTVTNTTTGRILSSDYARLADGHNATCLGRWT